MKMQTPAEAQRFLVRRTQVIDVAAFTRHYRDHPQLQVQVVTIYISESTRLVSQLLQAASTADTAAVRDLAHQLAGASANVYAAAVIEACHRLNTHASESSQLHAPVVAVEKATLAAQQQLRLLLPTLGNLSTSEGS